MASEAQRAKWREEYKRRMASPARRRAILEAKKRWVARNLERYREIQRNHNYRRRGMDRDAGDQRSVLLKQQRRLCAICGRRTQLHLDHDHKTKRTRGLLCNPCNRGLGLLKDDPNILWKAINYLDKPPMSMVEDEGAV